MWKRSPSILATTRKCERRAGCLPFELFFQGGDIPMTAEIICVGTELLLGDIVNTNARFLSRELAELGITVLHQHVVGDNAARLKELVATSRARSDLLVFSGGLGPTA